MNQRCFCCGATGAQSFYEVRDVPVHSVLLMRTRQEAIEYPRGSIRLLFCRACGFIWNGAFDPGVHEYSTRYEETQSFSPTFNDFHRQLAEEVIRRFDLRGKSVLEIGCGKGEFLALLCELGDNRGLGFDPGYQEGRLVTSAQDRLTFIQDFYSEKYTSHTADLVCCKMTLEHIQDVSAFVTMVRRAIGGNLGTAVFFQIPDVRRILHERAFWDVYYEHCSYFSHESLRTLFLRSGFEVQNTRTGYGDQYLMIDAAPAAVPPPFEAPDTEALARDVRAFAESVDDARAYWSQLIRDTVSQNRRVVLWGGGSKAVAFLTTSDVGGAIEYAVDVNPIKHGTFLAGTGQQIVAPEFLREYRPDVVVLMNPIYREEVSARLSELGVAVRLLALDAPELTSTAATRTL